MAQQTTAPAAPDGEDLRCEYQTSEAHIATLTSGVWQSAAIVVGGSIAALAFLIDVEFTCSVAAAVSALGAGAVVVIAMWRYNWSRHKVSIDNCWIRMRKIELARGMRKNIILYLLKSREEGGKFERDWLGEGWRFDQTYKEFPEPPGSAVLKLLGKICDSLRSRLLSQLLGEIWHWLRPKLLSLLPRLPRSGQDVLHGTAFLVQMGWLLMIVFAWSEALGC